VAKTRSNFGADYSNWLNAPMDPNDPFQNPISDGQRVENARARASRAGTPIGSGYLNPESGELQDPDRGFGRAILSKPQIMVPLVLGSGILAGGAFGGGFGGMLPGGGGGASTAASVAPEISVSSSQVTPAVTSAAAAGGPSTSGGSALAGFGKLFGGKGLDPTALLLTGLSLFGGDEGQERQSFSGTDVDPVATLKKALGAITSMGANLGSRGPTKLRSSVVQPGPSPVQIPGLPFQIGGGLGVDPALANPSLLETQNPLPDPFAPQQAVPRTRQRNPNG
jgi:hypothetical protein